MPIYELDSRCSQFKEEVVNMSFETSPIRQPYIQNSQFVQNNGGGGNLGYMQQGKKKKKEEEKNLLSSDESDVLQLNSDEDVELDFDNAEEEKTTKKNWLGKIAEKIEEKITERNNLKSQNPFTNTSF